ncbi:MAG: hypothetical protein WC840_00665 [Candidatus Peribacteraceae bacterium]
MRRLFLFTFATLIAILIIVIALRGFRAAPSIAPVSEGESSSSSISVFAALPTRNVSYVGTIEDLGAGIYQQGTHKLLLLGGQFLLLESTDVNLNLSSYLGKRAEIRGSVQPTIETGSLLMRVEEVTLLEKDTGSGSTSTDTRTFDACGGIGGIPCKQDFGCIDDPSDDCDPKTGGVDCLGICVPGKSSESSAPAAPPPRSFANDVAPPPSSSSSLSFSSTTSPGSASSVSSVQSTASAESAPAGNAGPTEEQIASMSKQRYDQDALWTQKYCTSHVAFCIPVHKNWYFKSFGATTSNLWHVEFGIAAIDALNQGPIVLNLVSGTTASLGVTSGLVRTQGKDVVGFMDWKDGDHFELIADARLKEAVSYMLSHITAYNPGE